MKRLMKRFATFTLKALAALVIAFCIGFGYRYGSSLGKQLSLTEAELTSKRSFWTAKTRKAEVYLGKHGTPTRVYKD